MRVTEMNARNHCYKRAAAQRTSWMCGSCTTDPDPPTPHRLIFTEQRVRMWLCLRVSASMFTACRLCPGSALCSIISREFTFAPVRFHLNHLSVCETINVTDVSNGPITRHHLESNNTQTRRHNPLIYTTFSSQALMSQLWRWLALF